MFGVGRLCAFAAVWNTAVAHTVITYPGWRGNNLHTNGTLPQDNPDSIGIDTYENGTHAYPFGMQWMYPCGGLPQPTNRTKWPVGGGALSFQPGWFPGHSKALIYVNIGIQESGMRAPPNYSHPVVHPFQIVGPTNTYYAGQVCLPQVRMPANLSLQVGDNITIQIIETAQHGAALYSCVDVTLVEPEEIANDPAMEVTPQNCYNSSNIGFQKMFTTADITSAGTSSYTTSTMILVTALTVTMISLL